MVLAITSCDHSNLGFQASALMMSMLRFYIKYNHGAQYELFLPLRILLVKEARWHFHLKLGLAFIS